MMKAAERLSDDQLIRLMQARFETADAQGASEADRTALIDMVPALLHRFREKMESLRGTVAIRQIDLSNPAHVKQLIAETEGRRSDLAGKEHSPRRDRAPSS